ncbi:MAG TPA: hypothetical protein VNK82_00325 [Terriglobales bacterium]|nr:hypothetical protein [Terriglobales bacterium]
MDPTKVFVLASLILVSNALHGQGQSVFGQAPFQIRTEIGIRFNQNLGYENPELTFAVTPELNAKKLYVRGSAFYRTGNKLQTGNGYSTGGDLEAYFRVKRLLFGGGVTRGNLVTSQFQKGTTHPLIGGAVEFRVGKHPSRIFAQYLLRGSDDTNGLQGVRTRLEVDVHRRIRIAPYNLGVYRFFPSNAPQLGTRTGYSFSAGVSYVLWSGKERTGN